MTSTRSVMMKKVPLEYHNASVLAHMVLSLLRSNGSQVADTGLHWKTVARAIITPKTAVKTRVVHVKIRKMLLVKIRRYSKHIDDLMNETPSL